MSEPNKQKSNGRMIAVIAVLAAVAAAAGAGWAFLGHDSFARMVMDHDRLHAEHMASGMGHDETVMPGLRGRDATPEESTELAVMFQNFDTITREVENLPDGIRTITRSSDPEVMDVLVSHVVGMIARVEDGRDPEIIIQSPTLDIFFDRPDAIETTVEVTEDGIVVVQTSTDAEVVAALHTHAAEVSAMADRGMDAVHDMMAARAGN